MCLLNRENNNINPIYHELLGEPVVSLVGEDGQRVPSVVEWKEHKIQTVICKAQGDSAQAANFSFTVGVLGEPTLTCKISKVYKCNGTQYW